MTRRRAWSFFSFSQQWEAAERVLMRTQTMDRLNPLLDEALALSVRTYLEEGAC